MPLTALAVVSVAALAFAAGHASVTPLSLPAAADLPTAGTLELEQEEAITTPACAMEDIAGAAFDQVYRQLKGASADELRAWMTEIENITIRPKRHAAIASFFKTLMQVDPALAKSLMVALKEENRMVAIMAVKDAAPPRAMRELLEVMLSHGRDQLSGCSYDFVRDAIDGWSKTDPLAVKQFLEEGAGADLDYYFASLVRNWAAFDPDAALELVLQSIEKARARVAEAGDSDEPGVGEDFVYAWAEGFLEHDRAAALDYLIANGEGMVGGAIPAVVAALYKESPAEARAFILRLPAARQSDALSQFWGMADGVVYGDADDAVRSPEYVTKWMLEFSEEIWDGKLQGALLQWRQKDETALFAWMAELPLDRQARVVTNYRSHFSDDDAPKEFATIMSIGDVTLRDRLLEQVMKQAEFARAPMLSQLETSPLSAEQKVYLASLIPAPRVAAAGEDD